MHCHTLPVTTRHRQRTLLIPGAAVVLLLASCGDLSTQAPDHGVEPHQASSSISTSELNRQLASLRQLTARFQNFSAAEAAKYGTKITPCWYHSDLGGQGYHYGNPELIDGTVALLEPELIMYEPNRAGHMKLVGIEYIVPIKDWQGSEPPTLLGQVFHENEALGLYVLHVWLWKQNPAGIFENWNPNVSCQHAADSEDRS
ncbi:MAG: hypothetical protein H0U67_02885 [Gemmatimonadetes bacterium]|nr:hypothetical protein [Gemmatimonadota bacterium]